MALVKALPESDTKNILIGRLNSVQKIIDAAIALEKAKKAVEKAEVSKTQVNVDAAMILVKAIPNSEI